MKFKLFNVFLMLLISESLLGQDSGFTIEYDETYVFSIDDVVMIDHLIISGTFVAITHENGRCLNLFVPDNDKKINLKHILEIVEINNDSNEWPFYNCILGSPPMAFYIINNNGELTDYGFHETIIGQNFLRLRLREFKSKRINNYRVSYEYRENVSFCIASVSVKKLNMYNSCDHLQDGPKYRKSKIPSYVFDESKSEMKILLPESDHCR
jgi:hypothetical protein